MWEKFWVGFFDAAGFIVYILSLSATLAGPLILFVITHNLWWFCGYLITIPIATGLFNMIQD